MDPDQQPGSIASHVANTLESFRSLERVLSITAGSNYVLEEATVKDFSLQIENNFTRFQMWVGHQVAHRSGPSSLDYRLREAGHLQKQVIYLLTDICESLHTATSLVNDDPSFLKKNQKEGEDGIPRDNDSHSSFPDSDDDDESDVCDEGPTSSLLTLSSDIREAIDCLLRLSVAIANPAPLERFHKFGAGRSEDISFYEPRDIAYARNNFPTITEEMARALGKFITRRRQFFKYRHHERLASGEEPVISDKETETRHRELISDTVTFSLPERPKTVANLDTHVFVNNEDIRAGAGMWRMSYATLASDCRLPSRPSAAEFDIFRCPFCYTKISAKTDAAWEQHVFGDLRPYTCLFSECIESNLDFDRHESWQSHLLKYHWRSWSCPFKCQQPFSAAAELSRHIREEHLPTGTEEEIKPIAALGERDVPNNTSHPCPLCGHSVTGLAEYIDHVGCHLEQLALFALPSLETEDPDQKAVNSEKSKYEPEVDADSQQLFSEGASLALETHPWSSSESSGKGRKPSIVKKGKKAVRRRYWQEDIKLEHPVATPDVPADEQETKRKGKARDEAIWSQFLAPPETRTVLHSKEESKQELPTDFFDYGLQANGWDNLPDPQSPPEYFGYYTLDPPRPFTDDSNYPMPASTDYPSYSMPANPQSPCDYLPDCSKPATLQPHTGYSGYYLTQQHHPMVQAAAVGSTGEAPISCVYPGCTARPFKRRADLERHIRNAHSTESNQDAYLCDYSNCTLLRVPFHRRDHLRDHLHQYHGEDISKRRAPSDMGAGMTTWWRCPRCLARVYVSKHGYECPDCKKSRSEGRRRS